MSMFLMKMEELEMTDKIIMTDENELTAMSKSLFETQPIDDVHVHIPINFLEPELEEMPAQNSVAQSTRSKKMTSAVWKYFTIIEKEVVEGASNPVTVKSRRAVCGCGRSFAYSKGSKVTGTRFLKRHITNGQCSFILNYPNEERQLSTPTAPPPRVLTRPSTPRRRRSRTFDVPFDVDIRSKISKLIVRQGYPLHMVEHPGFVSWVQTLYPRFDKVSFKDVEEDCIALYLDQKQAIQKLIDAMPGKICLTLDLWSSTRTIGYFIVTGQFFDSEWRIHRKLLNIIMEPFPDSPEAFSKAVAASLSNWNTKGKLFSVTINQPLTYQAVDNLRDRLSGQDPLLVGMCLDRSLADTVQAALTFAHDIVKKVRDSVKYLKSLESRERKFQELKQLLQLPTLKCLSSIDNQTKWNTTYDMLLSASELKEVFACLDTLVSDYKNGPSAQDWKQIGILCVYLKPLFETANLLTTAASQKAYMFFHEAWKIKLELARGVLSQDPYVRELTKSMRNEFDKYWNSCCFVLAIAVVMDPRYKMKLVEFNFLKLYGEKGDAYVNDVNEGIHEIFLDYVELSLPKEANGMVAKSKWDSDHKEKQCNGVEFMEFEEFLMENMNKLSMTELDDYLEESLLPRKGEFDVIGWWKMNQRKYPTLSKMACDILSIPVCTVPCSSVFDTVRKEMDNYWCELRPETLEALICAKDWIQ